MAQEVNWANQSFSVEKKKAFEFKHSLHDKALSKSPFDIHSLVSLGFMSRKTGVISNRISSISWKEVQWDVGGLGKDHFSKHVTIEGFNHVARLKT